MFQKWCLQLCLPLSLDHSSSSMVPPYPPSPPFMSDAIPVALHGGPLHYQWHNMVTHCWKFSETPVRWYKLSFFVGDTG
jgi:hypothetical protein